jgi:hypothetical protein
VDRAGTDDHEQPRIVAEKDAMDGIAAADDAGGLSVGLGERSHQLGGRGKRPRFDDVDVGGPLHEGD